MNMYQKREMRKNKKMNEDVKSLPSTSINWYPGHMAKTRKQITEDLNKVDVILELLDARIPTSSQNPDIAKIIQGKNKIVILNKCDLADKKINKQWIEYYKKQNIIAVLVNANQGIGIKEVIQNIEKLGREKKQKNAEKGRVGTSIKVMILGIPNVGKSSIINRFTNKVSAQVGNKPGVTKQKQWVKVSNDIELLDTPGVLWPKFQDEKVALNLAITGTIKEEILEKTEIAYYLLKELLQNHMEKVLERYKLSKEEVKEILENENQMENENIMEIMQLIGKKRGAIVSGGKIDEEKTASILLEDFRSAKIGRISLEKPQIK